MRDCKIRKSLLGLLIFLGLSCVSACLSSKPELQTHLEEFVINRNMSAALSKFNPKFVSWKTSDYTVKIQNDATENKRHPYALELNLNDDNKNDIILDGHDDQQSIILCLLSNPSGYVVVVIKESKLWIPGELENWNDGKKEIGLNYYLWPYKNGKGFTLAYPQQTDPNGNLLNDGAIVDYTFKNGKFNESYQTL